MCPTWLLVLAMTLAGCQLIADFDRDKIKSDVSTDTSDDAGEAPKDASGDVSADSLEPPPDVETDAQ
ncbi:MAG: hypothetical protein H6715_02075 [Myxococcales bacterium]|nr:hypothetical protein [Myxococcales bacterium]MCB9707527.1 hypothetical protein [Myxococcales bacterium]